MRKNSLRLAAILIVLASGCSGTQKSIEVENPADTSTATLQKVHFQGIDIECPGMCQANETEAWGRGAEASWTATASQRAPDEGETVEELLLGICLDDVADAGIDISTADSFGEGTMGAAWTVAQVIAGLRTFFVAIDANQYTVDIQITYASEAGRTAGIAISSDGYHPDIFLFPEMAKALMAHPPSDRRIDKMIDIGRSNVAPRGNSPRPMLNPPTCEPNCPGQ